MMQTSSMSGVGGFSPNPSNHNHSHNHNNNPNHNRFFSNKTSPNSFAFANVGLSMQQATSIWNSLKGAIEQIHLGKASTLRFEELYRNAYTLVLHKHGDMLYKGVIELLDKLLFQVSVNIISSENPSSLLSNIVKAWNHHRVIMGNIKDILMYMDKTYVKNSKERNIYDAGLLLFRDKVVRHPSIRNRLKEKLMNSIFEAREGNIIDRVELKHALHMLVQVNVNSHEVYESDFESEFLSKSETYYLQVGQTLMANHSSREYLIKIQEILRNEEEIADQILDPSSKPKIRHVLQNQLIVKYAQRLVDDAISGCVVLLNENAVSDLARMYDLFQREPATLELIKDCMSKLVRSSASDIVRDKENIKQPKVFVQAILDIRARYHNIVENSFRSSRDFARALKESLEYAINLDSRSAQYLALFIDDMLKNKIVGESLSDIDAKINNVMEIFRYLQDKDVFEDFYKAHLSHRLLTASSVNDDIEKAMIKNLKAECGHQFTSRLEGMFKDMDMSVGINRDYEDRVKNMKSGSRPSCDLSVSVLTTGFWPIVNPPSCRLPAEATEAIANFTKFYVQLHTGRRLNFINSHGTADLKCIFKEGSKTLTVHTRQMVILLLYKHKLSYTFSELLTLTGLAENDLIRHLLSLAHPQVKVLRKTPNTKAIANDHVFTYNDTYSSKFKKIKIPLLSKSVVDQVTENNKNSSNPSQSNEENPDANGVVPAAVMEARKNRVEAALVRIMKSRKTLEHNELIAEVSKQLSSRFTVDPMFIKKRVESLIEREYIERDKENRRIYHYLA